MVPLRTENRELRTFLCFLFAEQVKHWRSGSWGLWRGRRDRWWTGIWHVGFRIRRVSPLQEFSGIEQRSPQRRIVAGPRPFEFSLAIEVGAHGFHLGIQIVEVVQHERLGKHGQLGRSEIVLPVMA